MATINQLLRLSHLPIAIRIENGEQVVASKAGGPEFSISELSDGERNALMIAATVLTATADTLILIDEPERHLHRSIIAPLLSQLFATRPDCAFVVSTHEVMLPIDHRDCKVILVRACKYERGAVTGYEANLLPANANIDDDLKKDILGARQNILFVEGAGHSLDKRLYSCIFPSVSIIAKSNCRDVEHSVQGIRSASELHWVNAFGIIDSDSRTETEINDLRVSGIYAVPGYSVESIYYNTEIQRRVTEKHAKSVGGDATARLAEAKSRALSTLSRESQRLSERIAERQIRMDVMKQLPNRRQMADGMPINITIETRPVVAREKARLDDCINREDLESVVNRYPVRETGALVDIAKLLGFQGRNQYEDAVITLLETDAESLAFVRNLFGDLAGKFEAT